MKFPVFDLHCDTAYALLGEELRDFGSIRQNGYHIDLTRAQKYPGYTQCFACFTTTEPGILKGIQPHELLERELAVLMREIGVNHDLIEQAYSAKEITDNFHNGKMSAIFSIEGPAGFGYDPELLDDLYKIGFRISTLGWNEKNILTGSCVTGGGLTDTGRAYVNEAQRLGMLIDVSHISDEGFWDIIECTKAPVIATHSNSRALCNVPRNLTDDMFRAIMETGGVVGINMCPAFLGEKPSLETVCDHICHFLELDTDGRHIALGGDLDGINKLPSGMTGVESYSNLADSLIKRGIGEALTFNIFWNNALNVMERCSHNHTRQ